MEWIKCSDRLPEEGISVIIYIGFVTTGFYQEEWFYDSYDLDDDDLDHEVTHWMPLPKPPE